jgi:hypothetical protein
VEETRRILDPLARPKAASGPQARDEIDQETRIAPVA